MISESLNTVKINTTFGKVLAVFFELLTSENQMRKVPDLNQTLNPLSPIRSVMDDIGLHGKFSHILQFRPTEPWVR